MQSKNGNCIALEDLNGYSENLKNRCTGVHGGHGMGIQNKDNARLLEFADSFNMIVGNTLFIKDREKLITLKCGGNSYEFDYVVVKKEVCNEELEMWRLFWMKSASYITDFLFRCAWKNEPFEKNKCEKIKLWKLN